MAWIVTNGYLTEAQMQNNATEFIGQFKRFYPDVTDYILAALLGNMEGESNINPGLWENTPAESGGYGLVQWTPYTDYSHYWPGNWRGNGDAQVETLYIEANNGTQWYPSNLAPEVGLPVTPPWNLNGYYGMNIRMASEYGLEKLTNAFIVYYLRPATVHHPERTTYANKWYQWITGQPPIPPGPGPGPGGQTNIGAIMAWWMKKRHVL